MIAITHHTIPVQAFQGASDGFVILARRRPAPGHAHIVKISLNLIQRGCLAPPFDVRFALVEKVSIVKTMGSAGSLFPAG